MVTTLRRTWLACELTVVFVVFPVALYFVRHRFKHWIIPTLLVTGAACLVWLLRERDFDRRRLWNTHGLRAGTWRILRIFVPGALLVTALTAVFDPELLLRFPRERPGLWLLVMVLYPLLSVFPQEVIFRTFFFHRYRSILPTPALMIAASGLTFGLAHLFFANWLAPTLTTLGGLLFARTYQRTGSTLQACLEHGLWGDFLFTVGLGWYFYGGSIALGVDAMTR